MARDVLVRERLMIFFCKNVGRNRLIAAFRMAEQRREGGIYQDGEGQGSCLVPSKESSKCYLEGETNCVGFSWNALAAASHTCPDVTNGCPYRRKFLQYDHPSRQRPHLRHHQRRCRHHHTPPTPTPPRTVGERCSGGDIGRSEPRASRAQVGTALHVGRRCERAFRA